MSTQSVAQTIHTSGPSLISSCLDYYLAASDEDLGPLSKLLRRTLTALVHHCSKADQFSVVAELLIRRFRDTTEVEQSKRMLDLLTVPCSVRQGSRLTRECRCFLRLATYLSRCSKPIVRTHRRNDKDAIPRGSTELHVKFDHRCN